MTCVTNPLIDFFYIFRMLKDKTIQSVIKHLRKEDNQVSRVYEEKSGIINHLYKLTYPMTHIIDNIYLGNACDASSYYTLKESKITNIINSTCEIPNYFDNEFEYFKINIYDINSNSFKNKTFNNILDYIYRIQNDGDKKILIHCYMGSSRSAALVILYLIDKYNYTIDEALKFIKNKRDLVNVNTEFIKNLRDFRREKIKSE